MADDAPAPGIEDPAVLTRVAQAGQAVSDVLEEFLPLVKAGADVRELCAKGDEMLAARAAKTSKKIKHKGIAFPTCISINDAVCHVSPAPGDPSETLAEGDLVKIDMGIHVDGYPAMQAVTVCVGASSAKPAEGPKADVAMAAYHAAEVAARLIKAGNDNKTVAKAISDIAKDYGVTPIEDMQCFQLKKNSLADGKSVIQNPSESVAKDAKKETFAEHETYTVDIYMTTSEKGKAKPRDLKPSIYRFTGQHYGLKSTGARTFYAENIGTVGNFPFPLHKAKDQRNAKLGVRECLNHNVVEPYPVLYTEKGSLTAQARITIVLTAIGTMRVTRSAFDPAAFKTDKTISDASYNELLATEMRLRKP